MNYDKISMRLYLTFVGLGILFTILIAIIAIHFLVKYW